MPTNTLPRVNQQSDCSICLEAATGDIRQLECGHRFHTRCYNNWARQCNGPVTCPNCRAPSSDENGNRNRNRSHDPFNFAYPSMRVPYGMQRSGFDSHLPPIDNLREMSPAELVVILISLLVIMAAMSVFISVSSTCMCRLHWNPGQTHMIEKSFWGGQSVYTRPDMCTYVC